MWMIEKYLPFNWSKLIKNSHIISMSWGIQNNVFLFSTLQKRNEFHYKLYIFSYSFS